MQIKDVEDGLEAKRLDEQRRVKRLAELEKIIHTLQAELDQCENADHIVVGAFSDHHLVLIS